MSSACYLAFASDDDLYYDALNAKLSREYPPSTQITIPISSQMIKSHQYTYQVKHCKGSFGFEKADWAIACGFWEKLSLVNKDINLLDYLSKLLPFDEKKGIGLLTFQNGIQCTLDDFMKMGVSIINKFRVLGSKTTDTSHFCESPLCVGLYNPGGCLTCDVDRTIDHFKGRETPTVRRTRLMLVTIANLLHFINPQLRWLHIVHSEGGAITHNAIKGMTAEQKKLI
jgi:hypothetical protein